MGVLNLSPFEFYSLTGFEYQCKVEGNHQRDLKEWEHTRFLGWIMQCMWSSEPERDFSNFFPMNGEASPALTEEEMLVIAEKHINYSSNNQNGS